MAQTQSTWADPDVRQRRIDGIRAALAAKREGRPVERAPKPPKSARQRVRAMLPDPVDVPLADVRIRPDAGFLERCVVVILRRSGFGNSRKVDSARVNVDADKRRIKATKILLDCAELADITSLDGEVDDYMSREAVPAPFFRSGAVYAIPLAKVPRVEARLRDFATLRRTLVDRFRNAYPDRVRESDPALGEVFNLRDYPSVEDVAALFSFTWEYVEFGVPGNLRRVDEALFEDAVRKAEESVNQVRDEVAQVLRAQLLALVEHVQERLSGSEDGKPKAFRDSLVSNLGEFLDGFTLRNLTNDRQCETLVERLRKLLKGVDADALRSSDVVRSRVVAGIDKVKAKLDTLVVDRGSRDISFEDD